MTNKEAEEALKGTVSSNKIELLWERFGISYGNDILAIERKGSIVLRRYQADKEKSDLYQKMKQDRQMQIDGALSTGAEPPTFSYELKEPRVKQRIMIEHIDLIKEDFWVDNFGEEFLKE